MAAAPLRIVCCFFAVFSGGALAAPTVTYDQRQHGDYNVQVDLDGLVVVLQSGDGAEMFPMRRDGQAGQQAGEKTHGTRLLQLLQLAERRNGAAARPKKKKKPVDCAGAVKPLAETTPPGAGQPQLPPYSSTLQPQRPQTTSQPDLVPVDYETPQQPTPDRDGVGALPSPAPVSDSVGVSAADYSDPPPRSGPDEYLIDDPYSVTPGSPDISVRIASSSAEADNMVAVETVENNPAPAVPVALISEDAEASKIPEKVVPTKFEEKPISVSSDSKTAGEKTDETIAATPHEGAKVQTKIPADGVSPQLLATPEPAVAADGTTVAKTAESSNGSGAGKNDHVSDEKPAVNAAAATGVQAVEQKKSPVELVAVKTVEKPTFAEALMADGGKPPTAAKNGAGDSGKKPATPTTVEKSQASASPVADVQLRANEKNAVAAETIVVKTAEKPAAAGTTAVESGITTGTKPVELLKDKSAAAESAIVVSKLAPQSTTGEMVAVKTIESSGPTVAAGNTVTAAAKTVIKSGNAKTTVSNTSNGSSIVVRKVADRRPLPSMTFDVATPKVARA